MDLNASLLYRHAPIGAGDVRDAATNTTGNANFAAVTIPAEAIGVYIGQVLQQAALLVFLGTGAGAPAKAGGGPAGTLNLAFDNHESTYYFPLDPVNPPTMFVAENGGSNADFNFHFVLASN